MTATAVAHPKAANSPAEVRTPVNVSEEAWAQALLLRCALTVDLGLRGFTVRDWLQLNSESVIDSQWQVTAYVPLRVNGVLIAWAEFEVVNDHRAVRITELD